MSALMSNYPNGFANGISVRGMPLLSAYPGKVYWVSSVNGSNSNDGTFQKPFATIDYAVGRCTANAGDIIVAMPGHTETVTAAAGLDLDVAGICILGLGAARCVRPSTSIPPRRTWTLTRPTSPSSTCSSRAASTWRGLLTSTPPTSR